MANIIFIDNFDSFSYNLVDELKVLGNNVMVFRNDVRVETIMARALNLSECGKVVIMLSPGPSAPKDANNLLPIIREGLGKYPMLGICLGHQALGEVLGGKVVKAPVIVHGKSSMMQHTDKLCFKGLPNPLKIARYHSLVVEDLPLEVDVLADYDGMCMSLYSEKYKVLGFQFHPESIMTTFGRNLLKNAISTLTE